MTRLSLKGCEKGIHLSQNIRLVRIEDVVPGILQADNMSGWQAGFESVHLIRYASVGGLRDREDREYGNVNPGVLLPAELDCPIDGRRSSQTGHRCKLFRQVLQGFFEMRNVGQYVLPELFSISRACQHFIDPFPEVNHVEPEVSMGAIIKGECIAGIQVDQSSYLCGIAAADGTQLFAGEGVPDQYRTIEPEGIYNRSYVVAEARGGVIFDRRVGLAGRAEAPACDAIDTIFRGEFWSKAVEDVSSISRTCEEYERLPAAAPIENFEPDVFADGHKLRGMRGGVRLILRGEGARQQRCNGEEPRRHVSHVLGLLTPLPSALFRACSSKQLLHHILPRSLYANGTPAAGIAYSGGRRLRARQIFLALVSKTPGVERHYCDGVERRGARS